MAGGQTLPLKGSFQTNTTGPTARLTARRYHARCTWTVRCYCHPPFDEANSMVRPNHPFEAFHTRSVEHKDVFKQKYLSPAEGRPHRWEEISFPLKKILPPAQIFAAFWVQWLPWRNFILIGEFSQVGKKGRLSSRKTLAKCKTNYRMLRPKSSALAALDAQIDREEVLMISFLKKEPYLECIWLVPLRMQRASV